MKLLLTLLLVSSAASSAAPHAPAPAQSRATVPAKHVIGWLEQVELARRFAALTVSGERFVASIRAAVMQASLADLADADDPRQRAYAEQAVDNVFGRAEPQIREQIPTLHKFYALAYAREFSTDELQRMLAVAATPAGKHFAATPTGKHYAARIRAIEVDPIVLSGEESLRDEANLFLRQAKKEACAKRAAVRIAAGDTKAKCSMG